MPPATRITARSSARAARVGPCRRPRRPAPPARGRSGPTSPDSSLTPKMTTPRIRCGEPSRRVPRCSHSVQTVSPSMVDRTTSALRSGTAQDLLPVAPDLVPPAEPSRWMCRCLVQVVGLEAVDEIVQCVVVECSAQPIDERLFVHDPSDRNLPLQFAVSTTRACSQIRMPSRCAGGTARRAGWNRRGRPGTPSPPRPSGSSFATGWGRRHRRRRGGRRRRVTGDGLQGIRRKARAGPGDRRAGARWRGTDPRGDAFRRGAAGASPTRASSSALGRLAARLPHAWRRSCCCCVARRQSIPSSRSYGKSWRRAGWPG